MTNYDKQIEDFKRESISDYFKMQMEENNRRRILYSSLFILMIFIPLLIISYGSYNAIRQLQNNHTRVQDDRVELQKLVSDFTLNEDFISTLKFENGKATVYLMDIYNGNYQNITLPVYFDKNYTHQCLGYFTIIKDTTYLVDISNYCQL